MSNTRKAKVRRESVKDVFLPKVNLKFKNVAQKEFHKTIVEKEIVFCTGPAGTGKSFISMYTALALLKDPDTPYNKIIIVKPAVEADEKLGSLPGTMEEKLDPFLYSSFYILEKILKLSGSSNPKADVRTLQAEMLVEVMALAYMRGINVDNTILLFEEAQNSTPRQMKTLLTRIGENSKYIINGDMDQSDRSHDKTKTGLYDAITRFGDIDEIGMFEFNEDDQVRNPIIQKILKRY